MSWSPRKASRDADVAIVDRDSVVLGHAPGALIGGKGRGGDPRCGVPLWARQLGEMPIKLWYGSVKESCRRSRPFWWCVGPVRPDRLLEKSHAFCEYGPSLLFPGAVAWSFVFRSSYTPCVRSVPPRSGRLLGNSLVMKPGRRDFSWESNESSVRDSWRALDRM